MKIANKQISKTFKLAKSFLCDGSQYSNPSFICNAIDDVAYIYQSNNHQTICKNIIMSRFPTRKYKAFPHTVVSYLREVVKVSYSKLTYKNVQQFRHRWLDSLIEEFNIPGYYKG